MNQNSKSLQEIIDKFSKQMKEINETEHTIYIYIISNSQDDKIYIGKSEQKDIQEVFNKHKSLSKGKKISQKIHQHMKEVGIQNFDIQIVDQYTYEYKDSITKFKQFNSNLSQSNILNKLIKVDYSMTNLYQFDDKKYLKQWQNQNKDKQKYYQQKNKENMLKKSSEYQQKNKQELYEKKKQQRSQNRDKYVCQMCNKYSTYSLYSFNRHLNRKDHQKIEELYS